MKRRVNKENMQEEYMVAHVDAGIAIEEIDAYLNDLELEPANWADVEELRHLKSQLQAITDRLYKRGEYAEVEK